MKEIVSISLGSKVNDYVFETEFLGKQFRVRRIATEGNILEAEKLLLEWTNRADAIGIGDIKFPHAIGPQKDVEWDPIKKWSKLIRTPVVTGSALRKVGHEWCIRHIQFKLNKFFNNTRILFISGMYNYSLAKVLSEYTDNMSFCDPIFENGIPKFLNSIHELENFAQGVSPVLEWVPSKVISKSVMPIDAWNQYILRKAIQNAFILMIPYHGFYNYLKGCNLEELGGKIVITSTVYDDRVQYLRERGVDVIIDTTPKVLPRVVALNVLEAMIVAALEKPLSEIGADDFLEIISEQRMDPRIVYPSGSPKRVNRFAFVIHPLSKEFLKKEKSIATVTKYAPAGVLDTIEKVIAYAPPFLYSKVTGIKSPLGVEAEGWLISVGGTPKQMLSHPPEFTYKRLLQAAKMAKRLGAQIMGLGAFTKVVGDAGVTVAKLADIPITTGNSYSASGALWAAADAARRMGLIEVQDDKKIKGKAMVIGATGAIGAVCCRLLAKAFNEVYMVDVRDAKLLALKESISAETPGTKLQISTRADKYLSDMDVIVTATSSAGKKILDIMKVQPGCVITDVARPLDLSPEDVAKRPDVLVIESGEIELPGNPEMKDIGLPPKVAYACLAETIVLALEGRYEVFTIGREIEWEKVREIYKLGLKHGMKLSAISGINGVYSDEDIERVKQLAIEARKNPPWNKVKTADLK